MAHLGRSKHALLVRDIDMADGWIIQGQPVMFAFTQLRKFQETQTLTKYPRVCEYTYNLRQRLQGKQTWGCSKQNDDEASLHVPVHNSLGFNFGASINLHHCLGGRLH